MVSHIFCIGYEIYFVAEICCGVAETFSRNASSDGRIFINFEQRNVCYVYNSVKQYKTRETSPFLKFFNSFFGRRAVHLYPV